MALTDVTDLLTEIAAGFDYAACYIRFAKKQSISAVCTGIGKSTASSEQGRYDVIEGIVRVARASIPAPWPPADFRVDVSTDNGVTWQTYRIAGRREIGGMVTMTLGAVNG